MVIIVAALKNIPKPSEHEPHTFAMNIFPV